MLLRIKELLKERKMTQADLAERLGVSPQNVRALIGSDKGSTRSLLKIANVLGVPIWQLFISPQAAKEYSDKEPPNFDGQTIVIAGISYKLKKIE